jgi:hypothetical protein
MSRPIEHGIDTFFRERGEARQFSADVMAMIHEVKFGPEWLYKLACLADRFDSQHPLPGEGKEGTNGKRA